MSTNLLLLPNAKPGTAAWQTDKEKKMKVKKAIDVCKRQKMIATFFTNDDEQWLCDGYACYTIYDLPILTEEYICSLYDIGDKQRDKIHFKINTAPPITLCLDDADVQEVPATPMDITVSLSGIGLCVPFVTEEGIVFIQNQYLEPLLDVPESEMLFFCRRDSSGKNYIAIKIGMLLNAVIASVSISDNIVDDLRLIYNAAKLANDNQKTLSVSTQENEHAKEATA